jgi:hypothetical protein
MSRSGNHAIIDWILAQAPGRTCFLNCAEPGTNPFATLRPLGADGVGHRASYAGFDLEAERAGSLSRKDLLVHSYEDVFLGRFAAPRAAARHAVHVGASGRRIDVLILRDPRNLFASRLASGVSGVTPETAVRIWCQHAREFLGARRHLRDERVTIAYDEWVSSAAYRRAAAEALGLSFDDAATRTVARCAGGSSFDGTAFDGHAQDMAVLDRWRRYVGDPEHQRLLTPEVLALAGRVFRAAGAEEIAA